ncbi:MAG: hypothetical protein ABJG68_17105 [Crocinitomicaceae bacterium]
MIGFTTSCSSQETAKVENNYEDSLTGNLYVSEFGQLYILQLNDTLFQTSFENNDGFQFDTTMVLVQDDSVFLHPNTAEDSFTLRYNWGGLFFYDNQNQIQVYDFAGYGMLGAQTEMWEIYSNPFYKDGAKVTIQGEYGNRISDSTKKVKGINIEPYCGIEIEKAYYNITGGISKVSYIDDSKKEQFALVLSNCQFDKPENFTYEGSTINISTGEAAISWNWADSEAYILEDHTPWTKEEEFKSIKVEGYLVQNEKGSYLKNWKIID